MGAEIPNRTPLAIKRVSKRARLVIPAKLLTATGELDVRLRDLSPAGALAEAAKPPPAGSEVVVVCGSAVAAAGVVWVIGRRFGLEFRQLLSAEDVAVLAGEGGLV
jgi:PilZ domain